MVGQVVDRDVVLGRRHPAPDRNTGGMNRVPVARHEPMPPHEVAPLGDEPVGTGGWQPGDAVQGFRGELDAIGNPGLSFPVARTPAGYGVEEGARDVGVVHLGRVFVLELDETTAAAAVAQALPFSLG